MLLLGTIADVLLEVGATLGILALVAVILAMAAVIFLGP